MPVYERHARLVSRRAPESVAFLNGPWQRDVGEPVIGGRPHYVQPHSGCHVYFQADAAGWHIAARREAGAVVYFAASSVAWHPNTVPQSAWRLAEELQGADLPVEICREGPNGEEDPVPAFEICCEGPNTEEQPFLLEEIGVDFFVQQVQKQGITWFEAPTGEVFHSCAKGRGEGGGRARLGKRYCPICRRCFSANNFRSQHLLLHLPGRPRAVACVPDGGGGGGGHLSWEVPPERPGEPKRTGFHLRFSTDGGLSWQTGVENTNSPTPRARVASLSPWCSHTFTVAGVNVAGRGALSEASPPVCAPLCAPDAPDPIARVPSDVVGAFVDAMAADAGVVDGEFAAALQNLLEHGCGDPEPRAGKALPAATARRRKRARRK